MVEIVLHRIPDAYGSLDFPRTHGEAIRVVSEQVEEDLALGLRCGIIDAIPEGGITPEEVFELVMVQAEWDHHELPPHQFFLAIVDLLDRGFISASTRAVGAA